MSSVQAPADEAAGVGPVQATVAQQRGANAASDRLCLELTPERDIPPECVELDFRAGDLWPSSTDDCNLPAPRAVGSELTRVARPRSQDARGPGFHITSRTPVRVTAHADEAAGRVDRCCSNQERVCSSPMQMVPMDGDRVSESEEIEVEDDVLYLGQSPKNEPLLLKEMMAQSRSKGHGCVSDEVVEPSRHDSGSSWSAREIDSDTESDVVILVGGQAGERAQGMFSSTTEEDEEKIEILGQPSLDVDQMHNARQARLFWRSLWP